MIRFTFQNTETDVDVSADICTVAAIAATIADWGSGIHIQANQTSATAWIITAEGETVTAEVLP